MNDGTLVPSPLLGLPYHALFQERNWEEYISLLCQDGLCWFFDLDTPAIVAHLMPLASAPVDLPLPTRLALLRECVTPAADIERFERLYDILLGENDYDGACAAAGAAILAIYDGGTGFERFGAWYERLSALMDNDAVAPHAKAAGLGYMVIVELTYQCVPEKALETSRRQLVWAERARSSSLRLFSSVTQAHCLFYACQFSRARIILTDMAPLCELADASIASRVHFQSVLGLSFILTGDCARARAILDGMVNAPQYDMLPPSVWLMGVANLMFAVTMLGDDRAIGELSEKIIRRSVPEQNHYFHGYVHFNLAVANLALRKPHLALIHARECADRGGRSGSMIPAILGGLLEGQALADLHKDQEALDHLARFLKGWDGRGYRLFTVTAMLEMAALSLRRGRVEEARRCFERAHALVPEGEVAVPQHRPPEFLEDLRDALYREDQSAWQDANPPLVRIETLGEFRIHVADETIYDRNWKGGTTKALLKAIIAFGGSKVSAGLLCDALWPDAEADMAMNNLKVALSRLRRVGGSNGADPLPWIAVRHKQVSLVRSLCAVDSILFQEKLDAALKDSNSDLLPSALDLYQDDFLVNENSDIWIVRQRETLRDKFIKGAFTLHDAALTDQALERAIPYLHKAVETDPLNEQVHARLMRAYLTLGMPARALKAYRQAEETFRRELGIEPGAMLTTLAREAGGD